MLRPIVTVFLLVLAVTTALLAIRFLLVEPDEVASACAGNAATFTCTLRNMAIYGFAHHLFGPLSLITAVLAWIGAMRVFAVAAIITGIAGVVLYDFDVAGFGMLLGVVLYIRVSLQRLRVAQAGQ